MHPLEKYNLVTSNNNWITVPSQSLCGLVSGFASETNDSDLSIIAMELMQSYYYQWMFVINSYKRLYELHTELGKVDSTRIEGEPFTEFDKKGMELQEVFGEYAYLFVVSVKTLLDLFVCLIDIVQNQENRGDYLPDFRGYYTKKFKVKVTISALKSELDILRNNNNPNWIGEITTVRNNIIHRGYSLKPLFLFEQTPLIIECFKARHFSTGVSKRINISTLFESFITEMPKIEDRICAHLTGHIPMLQEFNTKRVTFEFGGLATRLVY